MLQWRYLPSGTWIARARRTPVCSVTFDRGVIPTLSTGNQEQMLPDDKSKKEKEQSPHVDNSVRGDLWAGTATSKSKDISPVQVPGMADQDIALSADEAKAPVMVTNEASRGQAGHQSVRESGVLQVGMANGFKQCDEAADDTCSTFSLLSIGSIKAYLGKRKRAGRTNDDAWLDLEKGGFDGLWLCNPKASDAVPLDSLAWAHAIKIKGACVVLGNGQDAALQTYWGRILLMNGELVRVGDRLLLYFHTFTLIYEKCG
eukprot:TRINITY_DN6841_c0_g2_i1.p1 TRINITY_DN6841_c0_g2~~TRINITY_DN6841_c0_g2_i1.p1  ORF type:complete len:259 (+),score=32.10 TRINITY_DN6841_c0_g2_i1:96-872(+)